MGKNGCGPTSLPAFQGCWAKAVLAQSRLLPARVTSPNVLNPMNLLPTLRWVSSSSVCALLVACAGTGEPAAPTVVRTAAPQGYEKTINNFLAFRIRGPRNNSQITVGHPEPGDCALDGYARSIRGWVVPVAYETRAGELTGKETIKITVKPYYFWFLGDTIAGVTPRIELCPGLGATFTEAAAPAGLAPALPAAAAPSPPRLEAQRGEEAGRPEPSKGSRAQKRVKAARGQGHDTARATKKTGKSSFESR